MDRRNKLNDLLNLEDYSLPTLEISADADEQDVADIFVRVNSGGQTLTENNFIQTLISVYEKDVHDNITSFCEQSRIPKDGTSYNHIMEVDPQHLVRMAVGLGFHRARLRYAYMLLRGKDLETGQYSDSTRTDNLQKFKDALDEVMNLSDRILVMYEGEIVGEFDPKKTNFEELGLYMAGAKRYGKMKTGV